MSDFVVGDLMTREVAVIEAGRDLEELERLLLDRRVHGVPVVDEDEVLVGVVSQTDLLAWHHDQGVDGGTFYEGANLLVRDHEEYKGLRVADIRAANVRDVMSPVVHCIRPDRPAAVAAATMVSKRIHRLIVVDEHLHVLGIIAALDLLRAVPGIDEVLEEKAARRAKH